MRAFVTIETISTEILILSPQELGKPSCGPGLSIRIQGLIFIVLKTNGQLRPLYTPYTSPQNLSVPFHFLYILRYLLSGYSFVYSELSFQTVFLRVYSLLEPRLFPI